MLNNLTIHNLLLSMCIATMDDILEYAAVKNKYPRLWSSISNEWEKAMEIYQTAVQEERNKKGLMLIPKFTFQQVLLLLYVKCFLIGLIVCCRL